MAYSKERRAEVETAIRKALHELKPGRVLNLVALQEKFPDISVATINRWCDVIRNSEPAPKELDEAYRELEERGAAGVTDHLPAMPSPGAIARDGGKKLRELDFAVEIQKLYHDAEMLRAFGIKVVTGDNGELEEKIKNPMHFERSIARRASLIETSLKVLQEIWDMRTMQNFYQMIVEEIGKADPETQKRIMVRLAALNQRYGMTMSMRL